MSKKETFSPIETEHLNYFNLDLGSRMGLFVNNSLATAYITEEVTEWEGILKTLQSSNYDLANHTGKKRAYVLNNCEVSLDRIKAISKEHKITITNDIDKADLIITHDNIGNDYKSGDYIRTGQLAFKLWNYDTIQECFHVGLLSAEVKAFIDANKTVIGCGNLLEKLNWNVHHGDVILEGWGLSGNALKIAYLISTKEVETIDINTLLSESANKIDLCSEMYSTISSFLESHTSEDQEMVKKILPTINYGKHRHHIWQLAQSYQWEIERLDRDKDVSYWLSKSNWDNMKHWDAEDVILHYSDPDNKEKPLTQDEFIYLEKICREQISINNRELYVFKVKLKKEFRHYYESKNV